LITELDVNGSVIEAIGKHTGVERVTLTGSRARGDAGSLSDWDFEVKTAEFRPVAVALPHLVASLEPLAQQWDRLSDHACYMLMLREIGKVDLIFEQAWESSPPWHVSTETLSGIDDHFWDWTIWLAAKDQAGKQEMVRTELQKMQEHLLAPLGVEDAPASVREAVEAYLAARAEAEERFTTEVSRALEYEVRRLMAAGGYAV
jgi:predicted nucleotidyltransferase